MIPIEHPCGHPRAFALAVPGGVVELHASGLTTTRYPGVGNVDALPHDSETYRARAAAHGYGDDVFLMSREHEIAHSLLARLLGLPHSPTLMGVAAGRPWPSWRAEEGAVLALQLYARTVGVGLVAVLEGGS